MKLVVLGSVSILSFSEQVRERCPPHSQHAVACIQLFPNIHPCHNIAWSHCQPRSSVCWNLVLFSRSSQHFNSSVSGYCKQEIMLPYQGQFHTVCLKLKVLAYRASIMGMWHTSDDIWMIGSLYVCGCILMFAAGYCNSLWFWLILHYRFRYQNPSPKRWGPTVGPHFLWPGFGAQRWSPFRVRPFSWGHECST